ncbi:unnamed protein product [Rotaria magnacalcarata]|uniref:Apple domain-containing protein n=1 Tax=Rotaria magnacalcarata TaxID=392030 RepID=A0A815K336_9BILA|nr:unnamed protein product [Rotaria magnacalcarata]
MVDVDDCGASANGFGMTCNGFGGQPPATLAEFTLGGWGGSDYYDLSNVDGNSTSMTIRPISGQYTVVNNPSLGKPNGSSGGSGSSLQWNGNKWTLSCDFPGNDMSNVRTRGEDCGGKCAQTSGCTHFAWNTYEGGTCWLKSGSVSKSNAVPRSDIPMICGVV